MIKAEELRIGNKFYMINSRMVNTVFAIADNTERGKFNCDTPTNKEMYSHLITTIENGNQYKPWEMDGIPVDESWFEKLGLTRLSCPEPVWRIEDMCIELQSFQSDAIEDYWCWKFSITGGQISRLTKIKYVHQLQNLFFVLTGRELSVIPKRVDTN